MTRIVQYPCALDENNNLVFINDVIRESRHEHSFRCPQCGHPMRPLQGEHNTWCFAHSENQKCGQESFIHASAKIILARRFNERKVPFMVGFSSSQSCKLKDTCKEAGDCHYQIPPKYEEFNLQDSYDLPAEVEINMLEPDGETWFRPDVLLRSSNPKRDDIYIEVYHKSKSKEAKYKSGHQIIEIRVRDIMDLKALATAICFKEGPDIQFFNFKERHLSPDEILGIILQTAEENGLQCGERHYPSCKQSPDFKRRKFHIQRLIIYNSGKAFRSGIYENDKESSPYSQPRNDDSERHRGHCRPCGRNLYRLYGRSSCLCLLHRHLRSGSGRLRHCLPSGEEEVFTHGIDFT